MIVLFPTYARRSSRGWTAHVAGMVARPLPERSRRRVLAVAVLRRLLELDDVQVESDVFRRRAESFLFQRLAGRRVRVAIGDRVVDAGLSDRTGHFQFQFDFDEDFARAWARTDAGGRRLTYEPICAGADGLADLAADVPGSVGNIHLVEEGGVSVISDIDDTVKVSNVADRRELLRNTFVREFVAVPGIADVYRRWREAGAAFHYVSASPWQLSECLCSFLGAAGLPAGSMHLKLFRLKDSTPLGRLPSRKRSKRRTIEQIIHDFPGRRFLLVGDCGERDPELYAAVARQHPEQVAGILIRDVPARKDSPAKVVARLGKLGRRLPPGLLRTFAAAADLPAAVPGGLQEFRNWS